MANDTEKDKDGKGQFWKKFGQHLKKFAPTLLETVGDQLGGPAEWGLEALARLIAGAGPDDDRDEVAKAIMADPALMVRMEELALERERAHLAAEKARSEAETARIQAVNATMQSEAKGEDAWTRRWRPYFGFICATVWGILGLTLSLTIVLTAFGWGDPQAINRISNGMADLTMFWSVALAVLGISAWTRGQEKVERVKQTSPLGRLSVE